MNTDPVRLPFHRRYNWFLVFREWRAKHGRAVWLAAIAIILGLAIKAGDIYLLQQAELLNETSKHLTAAHDLQMLICMVNKKCVESDTPYITAKLETMK